MNRPSHTLPSPLQSAPLPEVINHTPWPSQYFQHIDQHGEVFHVMVSRTTYSLREFNRTAVGLPTPTLLPPDHYFFFFDSDQFVGAVNASSLVQESDYAPFKPKCDVLLVNAIAHTPDGKEHRRWPVGFRFGDEIQKTLQVTGPRHFERGITSLGMLGMNEPQAATQVPLCYELAFGGPNLIAQKQALTLLTEEASTSQPVNIAAVHKFMEQLPSPLPENPIGCGREPQSLIDAGLVLARLESAALSHQQAREREEAARSSRRPAPQIEALNRPYRGESDYPVIGVGPIGRWWRPRLQLAGTYDAQWKQTQWPKSPLDHDYRYWNCAPEDQQIDYPQGGEEIALANLVLASAAATWQTRDGGPVRFALPTQDLQLLVRLQVGVMMFAPMHIDTIVIDFKAATLSIVRRATLSARTEVRQLELGTWPAGTGMQLDEEMKSKARPPSANRKAGAHGR